MADDSDGRAVSRAAWGPEGAVLAGLLLAVALASPAHALHQRVAALALPSGSIPTSSALDAPRELLLIGTTEAAAAPEMLAIDLGATLRAPRFAWGVEIGATVHDVAVADGLALLATSDDAAELVVVDLATRSRVGAFDAPGDADGLSVRVAGDVVKLGRRKSDAPELYRLDASDPAHVVLVRAAERPRSVRARRVRDVPRYAYSGTLVTREESGDLLWLVTAPPVAEIAVVERIAPVAFADADGDGTWRLGCVGDSNTAFTFQLKWCELLRDAIDDPDLAIVNVAVSGATVVSPNLRFFSDATQQMARVLPEGPDAVVLAFGTNDRFQSRTPEEVQAAYEVQAAVASAAGVAFYAATTPPLGGCIAGGAGLPCQRIAQQNALLRAAFGERVLEFFDGFGTPHFYPDDIHLNVAGQALRAERALGVLGPR
ncbi:MAG: SGNH/GDSL hydrolase family protein [Deltaproteobacteria bacterium]|nr:SGNH/GDSL hydrolase family protein [Deltaproteobacteria bacterium]